ncbi:hypothetical protein IU11_19120 [Cellulosimicrobium sp. MM]|nr:hypothetical protein IU11_19120 [Cellulosimicrobium sp. MM]
MTSAVTSIPRPLAQRTISTEPAVDRWHTCRREPTCSARSTSRAMIASSATAGQPARPSSADTTPSFIWAPSVRRGSCACWATTPSNALTYSRARRMRIGSSTHFPSSENTRTRAAESAIAPSSASCSPASPTETAPTGCTSTQPASRPRRHTCSTTPAVSATGVVFAIACTAVKPPAAAARVPDAIVSASSRPGSRRWVCRSTSPGKGDEARRVDDDRAVVVRGARGADRGELGDHAVREDEVDGVAAQRARAAQDVRGGCGAAHEAETLSTAGTGWAEGRGAADAAASASSLPARRR